MSTYGFLNIITKIINTLLIAMAANKPMEAQFIDEHGNDMAGVKYDPGRRRIMFWRKDFLQYKRTETVYIDRQTLAYAIRINVVSKLPHGTKRCIIRHGKDSVSISA